MGVHPGNGCGAADCLEQIVEEVGQLVGVEVPALVPVVTLEDLVDVAAQLVVGDIHRVSIIAMTIIIGRIIHEL